MDRKYSNTLIKFKELIKNDNKRIESKRRSEEKRDLLEWFVDNCPSKDGPETAKKFSDYGIKFNVDYSKLKQRIINSVGLKKGDSYRYCMNGKDMEMLIDEIENFYSSRKKEIIYFSKGRNAEMDSLYIRIRNSFAHGNYFKKRDYYYLWNETGSKNRTKKLGSFMVLKYEHLRLIYNALHIL